MKKKTNFLKYFLFDPITGFPRRHTFRKLVNLILNQLSMRVFKSTRVFRYPIHMNIEVNNTCNLKCPMCSSGQDYSARKRGLMKFESFKRIIDEISPYLYKLGPFNLGEPLLHPEIFKMIKYAQDKNISVILSTNGNLMDEEKSLQTIESGLEELIISMDAATEKTYKINRPGGDFNKVKQNIRRLMELRKSKKSKLPFVTINMILMDNNTQEIEDFKRLATELGVDKYNFSTYWEMYLGDSEKEKRTKEFVPKNKSYKNIMPAIMRVDKTCGWAWSGCIIGWDGKVMPCCFDYNETYILGNVFDKGIKNIWNNEKYRWLRKMIIEGRKAPKLCQNCPRGF